MADNAVFDDQGTEIGPQPGPQTILLACDAEEVFFGGALASGKSYALGLALENQHQKYGGKVSGIIFRQSVPELDDLIKTFKEILEPFGWEYLVGKKTFRHPDGAECRMRHLESAADIRKYWGHQYCVGKGTPILMGDGTYTPIEDVRVGDLVMTLEGAKRVVGLMPARVAECVKAEIFDADGVKLAEQIQPSKHPLLSSAVKLAEQCGPSSEISEKSLQALSRSWLSFQSLLDDHRATRDGGASSEGDRISCAKADDSNRDKQPLQALSCPLVLHEPSVRLARWIAPPTSTESRFPCKSEAQSSVKQEPMDPSRKSVDSEQPAAQLRSLKDLDVSNEGGATSCVLHESETESDCRHCYSRDCDRCGAPLRHLSDSALSGAPSPADVAELSHDDRRQDGRDNIRQCNRRSPVFAYIHPYTAMQRDVVETIQIGSCVMTPAGAHEVYDLSVEDANHYITFGGAVSKNTFMGVDEYGDFGEEVFLAIQKLRAARLRSASGVKVQAIMTGNPCGTGHKFCKERYIDPAPAFTPFKDPRSKHNIIFIPGKMENNIRMLLNDPEYRERCKSMGPDWYVKALIDGDWTVNPEGSVFQREWFDKAPRFDPTRLPDFWFKAVSWDTAFKTTKESARSAGTCWAISRDGGIYLLDGWAKKVEFPKLLEQAEFMHRSNAPCNYTWIEDKASGQSLIQTMKDADISKRMQDELPIPVKAVKVDGDKLRRAFAVTPYFEQGKIFLPQSAPWLDEYIEEMCSFPAPTGYSDYVDSTSQGVTELIKVKKRLQIFSGQAAGNFKQSIFAR